MNLGFLIERWRWYHFYFILAVFDLLVILASIGLYQHSLRSYEAAVHALSAVGTKQEFVTNLRAALVALNAPGNDIFASRDLAHERERFAREKARLESLLQGAPLRPTDFEQSLATMVKAEEEIFAAFEGAGLAAGEGEQQRLLDGASARMASMDRSQAMALRSLVEVDQQLHAEQQGLLREYERALRASATAGRYFSMTVLAVLAGTFWFGRVLQRANERMLEDRRRVAEERHARLAAIGEVCATVAHGIRNPLAAISAAAQVGQADAPAGPVSEALQDILAESRRLDERARRLLDFARPLEPQLAEHDAAGILNEVAATVRSHHKGIDLRVSGPAGLRVVADRAMLSEALYELAANGIRAMRGKGRLQLDAGGSGGRTALRVIDEGPGIPEAVQPRLFELFFTTRDGGTGVGLATVRKLAQVQGGMVCLERSGPAGTVFRIELPAEGAE